VKICAAIVAARAGWKAGPAPLAADRAKSSRGLAAPDVQLRDDVFAALQKIFLQCERIFRPESAALSSNLAWIGREEKAARELVTGLAVIFSVSSSL
jgi:hypothetical protein